MGIVSTLSIDALAEIFDWAITFSENSFCPQQAPLNLSHTCRVWRTILLQNGRFWARVKWPEARAVHVRLAALFLDRSASALLHYKIGQLSDGSGPDEIRAWHELLFKKQERWRVVEMAMWELKWVGKSISTFSLRRRCGRRMESTTLRDLSELTRLVFADDYPFATVHDKIRTKGTPPLFLIPPSDPVNGCPIAPQLTSLICHGLRGGKRVERGMLIMLNHCPALEDLELVFESTYSTETPTEEDNGPICILRKLKRLTIGGRYTFSSPTLLPRRMETPVLHELHIQADPAVVYGELPNFLTRSKFGGPVCIADISSDSDYSEDEVVLEQATDRYSRLLAALPKVKHLNLDVPNIELAFRLLDRESDNIGGKCSNLCPLVENLRIVLDTSRYSPNSLHSLLDSLFKSRSASGRGFHVEVRIVGEKLKGFKEELERYPEARRWQNEQCLALVLEHMDDNCPTSTAFDSLI